MLYDIVTSTHIQRLLHHILSTTCHPSAFHVVCFDDEMFTAQICSLFVLSMTYWHLLTMKTNTKD